MQRILGVALIAASVLAGPALAQAPAGPAAGARCEAPAEQARPGIRFFLGIQPSDGILDVWCRLQTLRGKYRVNVLFPETNAHRTFETTFDGSPDHPREELARFVQSLLPTDKDAPAQDEAGQPFPTVLAKAYQGLAPKTPDGQGLGLPPDYPGSKVIALWEPVVLRIRPLTIAEREFTLSILLKPNVGRFIMAIQGQVERFPLRGAKARVIPYSGGDTCPADRIPDCASLPEVVEMQTAWLVEAVKLEADGGGLSGATKALFDNIATDGGKYVKTNNMSRFSVTEGKAEVEVQDDAREILGVAEGDPKKVAGTKTIKVVWRERKTSKDAYATIIADWTKKAREQFVLRYVKADKR